MSEEHDVRRLFTQEFWDERYVSSQRIWSGDPNPQLVTHATELEPGTALDVGSGEGADAIWLADRGWRVTGVDVSQVALDRAARHAREAGRGDQVTWQRVDVFAWAQQPTGYDLVSAQFLHVPRAERPGLLRRLARAVRPGGTLVVVGHHPDDTRVPAGSELRDLLFTPDDVVAVVADDLDVVLADSPSRTAQGVDGPVTRRDAVVVAVRRSDRP